MVVLVFDYWCRLIGIIIVTVNVFARGLDIVLVW